MKSIVSKVVVFLIASLFGLILIEILLRFVAPTKPIPSYAQEYRVASDEWRRFLAVRNDPLSDRTVLYRLFDPVFHHSGYPYRYREGVFEGRKFLVRSNSLGLRGTKEFNEQKQKGVFRIATQGDSFTYGGDDVSDDGGWPPQLEVMLNKSEKASKCEVYNFGMGSYSPITYWQEYLHLVRKYHPDLLIVAVDNSDLQDDYFVEKDAIWDANQNIVGFNSGMQSNLVMGGFGSEKELSDRLKILTDKMQSKLWTAYNFLQQHSQILAYIKMIRLSGGGLNEKTMGDVRYDRYGHCRPGADWTSEWIRSSRYLSNLCAAAKADGTDVIIVFYPYPFEASKTAFENRDSAFFRFKKGIIYDTPMRKWLGDFCQKRGLPYIDTFDAFRNVPNDQFFFKMDFHYTAEGYGFLAAQVNEYLEKEYLPRKLGQTKVLTK
jgi:lysophospholipase L1-like esterase